MKLLKERILQDGKCFEGGILKVDSFINHQMDPTLMKAIAVEFVRRFASERFNKVMTIEASGIAPAIMVGFLLDLPVIFAKKKKPKTMEHMLSARVFSFTKEREYDICLSRDFLTPGDRVLFIDDFLANGNAALGAIELIDQAGGAARRHGIHYRKGFPAGRRHPAGQRHTHRIAGHDRLAGQLPDPHPGLIRTQWTPRTPALPPCFFTASKNAPR